MSRIEEVLKNKKTFIGFLTAGDQGLDKTEEFILAMEQGGVGLIEIGIPFSDPIAEGPVVQDANVRALSAPEGCTTDMVFDMVERVSKKVKVPLVFIAYLNQVFKYGYERFCKKCKETGVAGILIPDMPYEEKGELAPIAKEYDIDLIALIAPSSADRIPMIASESGGFLYLVSSLDVNNTEEIGQSVAKIKNTIADIRNLTKTPIIVNFAGATPEQIYANRVGADGFIVDNAFVKIIEEYGKEAAPHILEYAKAMTELL